MLDVTVYYPSTGAPSADAAENAAAASGTFPLVVFAHGFAVSAATYSELLQAVAAQGFVVAAPDFPRSSTAITASPGRDYVEQASDVSFVITSLLGTSTRPAALRTTIGSGQVAIMGHSDGGITAAGVAFDSQYRDPRVGAAVILSGGAFGFPGTWFDGVSPALLAIHGDSDEVNPFSASREMFAEATGAKWLVSVVGGSHLEPFTTDPDGPAVATVVADFLRSQLEGSTAATARLATDANVDGVLSLVATG